MKMTTAHCLSIGLVCILGLISHSVVAQDKALEKHLTSQEISKIESSQKLIGKGQAIIDELEGMQSEVDALKNTDGRIKTGKINRINKKIAEGKLKAAIYFEDGYNKHIKTLDKRLKEFDKQGNSQAKSTRDDVKDLSKKAGKQYNKSERMTTPDEMVELVELAQENQKKAIELQEKTLLDLLDSETTQEEVETPIEETVIESVADTAQAISEEAITPAPAMEAGSSITEEIPTTVAAPTGLEATGIAAATGVAAAVVVTNEAPDESTETEMTPAETIDQTAVIEEVETEAPVGDVFFSIQILADKTEVPEAQLQSVYGGAREIIKMSGDGWHRYSIGRFSSVETAKEVMADEAIKGYIVAYNKTQRISVREALDILNK